jgi:hypothetical protein
VAVRPLRVEELAEVLAVDFDVGGIPKLNLALRWEDQEEAVMSVCSSLVIVVKDGDSRIVQFSHSSVKEYLTSDRLADSSLGVSRYHILLQSAHTILAQACLAVLLRLDDQIDRNTIENFPLAQYAAEHWFEHALFEDVASRIEAGMERLFDVDKPHFAAWLWIYNPDIHSSMWSMRPQRPEAVPLYFAALFGFRYLTGHLLAKHPEAVHARGGLHVTPLHAAARLGHADIVSLLVEHLTDLDIQGNYFQTPLHLASILGHVGIGSRLLDRGADINARDEYGRSPLYIAAKNGHIEFTRMLLGRGAAVNNPSNKGMVPLHMASQGGHLEVQRLLLEHGADLKASNEVGETPSGRRSIIL